jgi:hypothetical protein
MLSDLANTGKVDFNQIKSQAVAFQFSSLFGSIYITQGLTTKLEVDRLRTRPK